MSISCVPHQEIALSARTSTNRAFSKNFLLGLAISALIWALLAAGTSLMVSWSPIGEQPQLVQSQ